MFKTTCRISVCLILSVAAGVATARAQQAPQPPVYTICTLLVGSAPAPVAPGAEGAQAMMTTLARASWSTLDLQQYSEDLAGLQEKLKSAFHVEQVDVISSYGDWMSPGREMILEGAGSGLKLVVTAGPVKDYTGSEVTVHRGDGTSYVTTRGNMVLGDYDLLLTQGDKTLLKKSSSIGPGMRSVFARQAEAGGPVYFIVLALPQPGGPMRTTWGWEFQGTSANGTSISTRGSGGVGKGSGSGSGSGAGVTTSIASGISGGGASGAGAGIGAGSGQALRAPRQIRTVRPTLPPEARAAGLKGPVGMTGVIAADGSVQEIKVFRSVKGLDEAAVAAFKRWRYEPPSLDASGKPQRIQVTVMMTFQEDD